MERVWDYPRPPAVVPCSRRVRIELADHALADSSRALRVLETSHPPTIYIPRADVQQDLLAASDARSTWCEFKGAAQYWDAIVDGRRFIARAILNLSGWNYSGRVEGHAEGEVIDLGKHKLRFLETPHVHHWDSMMLFDETTKSLFPSDLFIQPGDQPPIVTENLGSIMCEYYREIGIFAHDKPVRDVLDRIERLDPDWIHGMHGGSLGRETIPYFSRALRKESVGYTGKLLGREVLPS
jgi:uncharacterized protein (DUF427 family)